MMERKPWNKSWLLSKIVDYEILCTKEMIDIRKRNTLIEEYFQSPNKQRIFIGSYGEGFWWASSDQDVMNIVPDVAVLYSEIYPDVAEHLLKKTVIFPREADCQPGYVNLELAIEGENMWYLIKAACVPFQNSIFISSDIFRQAYVDFLTRSEGTRFQSNGPCASIKKGMRGILDKSLAFPFLNWPREASSWVCRTRLYGWPPYALINKIVFDGCHVVPVGDKCSEDTFLQWRVSFVRAERQLVYSLSHPQMRVYALMKYFLKQIHDLLISIVKDEEILSSYIVKTIIFYAVENSPPSMWQDNHTFTCFQFCLSILIDWVRSGYCPHYFIPQNNLFLRKVCGPNQQKLLQALLEAQGMKWKFLSSVRSGEFIFIGNVLEGLVKGETSYIDNIFPSSEELEFWADVSMFYSTMFVIMPGLNFHCRVQYKINKATNALLKSQTDQDEFMSYRILLEHLAHGAKEIHARHITSGGNRQTYKYLKRCKHLLAPLASLCASPGKLYLATFHYLVGNYCKALHLCKFMTSFSRYVVVRYAPEYEARQYRNTFCGKGYSWYQKCDGFAYVMKLTQQFCPHELLLEVSRQHPILQIDMPPLPYALFLTFLCHYHLGDTRRCEESLKSLERRCKESLNNTDPVYSEKNHGSIKFWIVYSLLGICYQYVGDYSMAITAFGNSLKEGPTYNPAKERIAMIYLIMCYQHWKSS